MQQSIGLFYGSTNGNTARVAQQIKACFEEHGSAEVELHDIADYYLEEMAEFAYIILGIPTWDVGQLQRDWEEMLEELDAVDLTWKRVALFGLGDQVGYPDTFVDALFFLAEKVRSRGGQLVGQWPISGYSFNESWGVEEQHFLGLVLDEDNQPEMTQSRIAQWVKQVKGEFYTSKDHG